MEGNKVVVCDNGTGFIKCGFGGENFPAATFPCIVGKPILRYEESLCEEELKDMAVGEACSRLRNQLEVSYPIKNGIIQNWEGMSCVWDHMLYEILKVEPSESKILLSDPPLNPTSNRQKMAETMFEKYNFAGLFIQISAILTLYAQGLLTGLVVDSGDGVTNIVPVIDGYSFPHATRRVNIAGRHITSYLIELLLRRGYALNRTSDFETAREIKEQLCYISYDFKREIQLGLETTVLVRHYTLPDGRIIKVGSERFQAPEALFNPELVDIEGDGLADLVFQCIQSMEIDNRLMEIEWKFECMHGNSGTTCTEPFILRKCSLRLEDEVRLRYLNNVLKGNKQGLKKLRLRIEDPPRRKYMVYSGGSVLAGIMKDEPQFWISRQEYEEEGFRCLQKCGQS